MSVIVLGGAASLRSYRFAVTSHVVFCGKCRQHLFKCLTWASGKLERIMHKARMPWQSPGDSIYLARPSAASSEHVSAQRSGLLCTDCKTTLAFALLQFI